MQKLENIQVHGIPLTLEDVDDENKTYGGVNKTWREMMERWIKWLQESEAVKSQVHKIKRMEIGSIAHFYLKASMNPFFCTEYKKTTCLDHCENSCSMWNRPDNCCTAEAIGEYEGELENSRDMALDTMHVLRLYFKPELPLQEAPQ